MTRAAIVLLSAAGATGSADPLPLSRGTLPSRHAAHIYYNLATGERVATLIDNAARPASGGSYDVWISDNTVPCAGFGQTVSFVGVMDTPDCTTCLTSTATGLIFLDWGDVEFNQVIDCVGIAWAADLPDADADGDGMADGVPGFGAFWAWYDGDNGFDSSSTRQGLVAIGLSDLPGNHLPFQGSDVPVYTATVDLAGAFSSSLAFEIGDTDLASSVGTFNPGAGIDRDADGLAEFSYAMRFVQPGTFDWDSDGEIDGSVDDQGLTAWPLATGDGVPVDNGDGTWTFEPSSGLASATGIEDAFDVFSDLDSDGVFEPMGTFWYGGINCSGDSAEFKMYSQFFMQLYGPYSWVCCPVDIYPPAPPGVPVCAYADGVLNIFDVMTFISWFANDDPRADWYTLDGGGTLNVFDVYVYLASYSAGCP